MILPLSVFPLTFVRIETLANIPLEAKYPLSYCIAFNSNKPAGGII